MMMMMMMKRMFLTDGSSPSSVEDIFDPFTGLKVSITPCVRVSVTLFVTFSLTLCIFL